MPDAMRLCVGGHCGRSMGKWLLQLHQWRQLFDFSRSISRQGLHARRRDHITASQKTSSAREEWRRTHPLTQALTQRQMSAHRHHLSKFNQGKPDRKWIEGFWQDDFHIVETKQPERLSLHAAIKLDVSSPFDWLIEVSPHS